MKRTIDNKWGKRVICTLTILFFSFTQVVSAVPGVGVGLTAHGETPGFIQLSIPADLASLDDVYEAPPSPSPRLILHVQNAHANYDAQDKIKQLLLHLEKTYGIKTIFVEGASENLNPDYLRFFPDAERNKKLADYLAKQGELTGPELFILENNRAQVFGPKSQKIRRENPGARIQQKSENDFQGAGRGDLGPKGIGIEKAELYRENYEALKKVFGSETVVNKYLGGFEVRLDKLASNVFSPDLRKILREWQKFEKGHREFIPYVKGLVSDAKRFLGEDLESLFAQVEWPQISRLLVLQMMEKDLDMQKGIEEKDRVVRFLKEKRVSKKLIDAIKTFQDQRVTMPLGGASGGVPQPRDLMEQLIMEAGPKGFLFHDYPHFSLYAGYLILKSELDPKGLFDEIRLLFVKILDMLAKTEQQQALLELFRDEELLRKLLNLELTRKNWQEVLVKKGSLDMDSMVSRLRDIGTAVSRETNLPLTNFETKTPNPKFRSQVIEVQAAACKFYEVARKREKIFYEKIDATMRKDRISKAVLVTGGFHTDGITELLREHEISYGILTPRLSEKSDEHLYRSLMLQNQPSTFELSYLEAASRLISPNAQAVQIGEGTLLKSLEPLLRAINFAMDSGGVAEAIKIFNNQKTGVYINPKPVRISKKTGKTIYQVTRIKAQVNPGGVTSGPRDFTPGVFSGQAGLPGLAKDTQIGDALASVTGNALPSTSSVVRGEARNLAVQLAQVAHTTAEVTATGEVRAPEISESSVRAEIRKRAETIGVPSDQFAATTAAVLAEMNKLATTTRSENRIVLPNIAETRVSASKTPSATNALADESAQPVGNAAERNELRARSETWVDAMQSAAPVVATSPRAETRGDVLDPDIRSVDVIKTLLERTFLRDMRLDPARFAEILSPISKIQIGRSLSAEDIVGIFHATKSEELGKRYMVDFYNRGEHKNVYKLELMIPKANGPPEMLNIAIIVKQERKRGYVTLKEVQYDQRTDAVTGHDGSVVPVFVKAYFYNNDFRQGVELYMQEFIIGKVFYDLEIEGGGLSDQKAFYKTLSDVARLFMEAYDLNGGEVPTDIHGDNIMIRQATGRSVLIDSGYIISQKVSDFFARLLNYYFRTVDGATKQVIAVGLLGEETDEGFRPGLLDVISRRPNGRADLLSIRDYLRYRLEHIPDDNPVRDAWLMGDAWAEQFDPSRFNESHRTIPVEYVDQFTGTKVVRDVVIFDVDSQTVVQPVYLNSDVSSFILPRSLVESALGQVEKYLAGTASSIASIQSARSETRLVEPAVATPEVERDGARSETWVDAMQSATPVVATSPRAEVRAKIRDTQNQHPASKIKAVNEFSEMMRTRTRTAEFSQNVSPSQVPIGVPLKKNEMLAAYQALVGSLMNWIDPSGSAHVLYPFRGPDKFMSFSLGDSGPVIRRTYSLNKPQSDSEIGVRLVWTANGRGLIDKFPHFFKNLQRNDPNGDLDALVFESYKPFFDSRDDASVVFVVKGFAFYPLSYAPAGKDGSAAVDIRNNIFDQILARLRPGDSVLVLGDKDRDFVGERIGVKPTTAVTLYGGDGLFVREGISGGLSKKLDMPNSVWIIKKTETGYEERELASSSRAEIRATTFAQPSTRPKSSGKTQNRHPVSKPGDPEEWQDREGWKFSELYRNLQALDQDNDYTIRANKREFSGDQTAGKLSIAEVNDSAFWTAFKSMPEVPEGHVRLFHQTGSDKAGWSIRRTGLRYFNGLNHTTHMVKKTADVNHGWRSLTVGTTLVFDVPENVYNEYLQLRTGVLPAQYFKAILPMRAVNWTSEESPDDRQAFSHLEQYSREIMMGLQAPLEIRHAPLPIKLGRMQIFDRTPLDELVKQLSGDEETEAIYVTGNYENVRRQIAERLAETDDDKFVYLAVKIKEDHESIVHYKIVVERVRYLKKNFERLLQEGTPPEEAMFQLFFEEHQEEKALHLSKISFGNEAQIVQESGAKIFENLVTIWEAYYPGWEVSAIDGSLSGWTGRSMERFFRSKLVPRESEDFIRVNHRERILSSNEKSVWVGRISSADQQYDAGGLIKTLFENLINRSSTDVWQIEDLFTRLSVFQDFLLELSIFREDFKKTFGNSREARISGVEMTWIDKINEILRDIVAKYLWEEHVALVPVKGGLFGEVSEENLSRLRAWEKLLNKVMSSAGIKPNVYDQGRAEAVDRYEMLVKAKQRLVETGGFEQAQELYNLLNKMSGLLADSGNLARNMRVIDQLGTRIRGIIPRLSVLADDDISRLAAERLNQIIDDINQKRESLNIDRKKRWVQKILEAINKPEISREKIPHFEVREETRIQQKKFHSEVRTHAALGSEIGESGSAQDVRGVARSLQDLRRRPKIKQLDGVTEAMVREAAESLGYPVYEWIPEQLKVHQAFLPILEKRLLWLLERHESSRPTYVFIGRDAEMAYDALKIMAGDSELADRIRLVNISRSIRDAYPADNSFLSRPVRDYLVSEGFSKQSLMDGKIILIDSGFQGSIFKYIAGVMKVPVHRIHEYGYLFSKTESPFQLLGGEGAATREESQFQDFVNSFYAEMPYWGWNEEPAKHMQLSPKHTGVADTMAPDPERPDRPMPQVEFPRYIPGQTVDPRKTDWANESIVDPVGAMLQQIKTYEYFSREDVRGRAAKFLRSESRTELSPEDLERGKKEPDELANIQPFYPLDIETMKAAESMTEEEKAKAKKEAAALNHEIGNFMSSSSILATLTRSLTPNLTPSLTLWEYELDVNSNLAKFCGELQKIIEDKATTSSVDLRKIVNRLYNLFHEASWEDLQNELEALKSQKLKDVSFTVDELKSYLQMQKYFYWFLASRLIGTEEMPPEIIRPAAMIKSVVEISDSLRGIVKVTEGEQGSDQEIYLTADGGALAQVVLNLLRNAQRAVETKFGANSSEGKIHVQIQQISASRIVITIEDNGVGMSDDVRAKVLSESVTTKETKDGHGIGLMVVAGLVESRLGGEISVESNEGKWTVFTLQLPVDITNPLKPDYSEFVQALLRRALTPKQYDDLADPKKRLTNLFGGLTPTGKQILENKIVKTLFLNDDHLGLADLKKLRTLIREAPGGEAPEDQAKRSETREIAAIPSPDEVLPTSSSVGAVPYIAANPSGQKPLHLPSEIFGGDGTDFMAVLVDVVLQCGFSPVVAVKGALNYARFGEDIDWQNVSAFDLTLYILKLSPHNDSRALHNQISERLLLELEKRGYQMSREETGGFVEVSIHNFQDQYDHVISLDIQSMRALAGNDLLLNYNPFDQYFGTPDAVDVLKQLIDYSFSKTKVLDLAEAQYRDIYERAQAMRSSSDIQDVQKTFKRLGQLAYWRGDSLRHAKYLRKYQEAFNRLSEDKLNLQRLEEELDEELPLMDPDLIERSLLRRSLAEFLGVAPEEEAWRSEVREVLDPDALNIGKSEKMGYDPKLVERLEKAGLKRDPFYAKVLSAALAGKIVGKTKEGMTAEDAASILRVLNAAGSRKTSEWVGEVKKILGIEDAVGLFAELHRIKKGAPISQVITKDLLEECRALLAANGQQRISLLLAADALDKDALNLAARKIVDLEMAWARDEGLDFSGRFEIVTVNAAMLRSELRKFSSRQRNALQSALNEKSVLKDAADFFVLSVGEDMLPSVQGSLDVIGGTTIERIRAVEMDSGLFTASRFAGVQVSTDKVSGSAELLDGRTDLFTPVDRHLRHYRFVVDGLRGLAAQLFEAVEVFRRIAVAA